MVRGRRKQQIRAPGPRKQFCEREQPETSSGVGPTMAMFAEVMEGSVNTRVDPRACIPLTSIRPIVRSGVRRMKKMFIGNGVSCGYVAGSDSAIIVPLTGSLRRYVIDYFKSQRKEDGTNWAEEEAVERSKSRAEWFGVVDGLYRLVAILELLDEEYAVWKTFTWPVTILSGGHDIQTLKQLARHQNRKHDSAFYVETTFYDVLHGLVEEAHRLKAINSGKMPTAASVAEAYNGSKNFTDNTIKQTAGMVMRLDIRVLHAIGSITNEEVPELANAQYVSSGGKAMDRESAMESLDCRVYRKFIHVSTLKTATVFMNGGKTEAGVLAQIATLYRLRELSRANGFRAIGYKHTVNQFERALAASREVKKFETLRGCPDWPQPMKILRDNMLRSTKLDEEIMANKGNDYDIVDSILDMYRDTCPEEAPLKIRKYRDFLLLKRKEERQQNEEEKETESGGPSESTPADNPPAATDPVDENTAYQDPITDSDGNQNGDKNMEGGKEGDEQGNDQNVNMEDELVRENNKDSTERDDVADEANEQGGGNTAPTDPDLGKENNPSSVQGLNDTPGTLGCGNSADQQTQSVVSTVQSERLQTGIAKLGELRGEEDYLKLMKIKCYQMTWQNYDKSCRELGNESDLFDLLITDIPYGTPPSPSGAGKTYENYCGREEMAALAGFSRRVVVPGGWVFIFTSYKYLEPLSAEFSKVQFKCPGYPFTILKDTRTVQQHRGSEFPQNATEIAFFAKAPSSHREGFKLDLYSPYHIIHTSEKRKFACLSQVPVLKAKLLRPGTKSPVLVEEKDSDVIAEIMTTFCPDGGSTLDTYAGTMSSCIAALKTGRSCIGIEQNPETFRLAHDRLRLIAKDIYLRKQRTVVLESPSGYRPIESDRPAKRFKGNSDGQKTERMSPNPSEISRRVHTPSSPVTKECEPDPGSSANMQRDEDGINQDQSKILSGGDEVHLLVGEKKIGTATLLPGIPDPKSFRDALHNHSLSKSAKEGEHLVAAYGAVIEEGAGDNVYPYAFMGVEEPPKTVKGLVGTTFSWDVHKMVKRE